MTTIYILHTAGKPIARFIPTDTDDPFRVEEEVEDTEADCILTVGFISFLFEEISCDVTLTAHPAELWALIYQTGPGYSFHPFIKCKGDAGFPRGIFRLKGDHHVKWVKARPFNSPFNITTTDTESGDAK